MRHDDRAIKPPIFAEKSIYLTNSTVRCATAKLDKISKQQAE